MDETGNISSNSSRSSTTHCCGCSRNIIRIRIRRSKISNSGDKILKVVETVVVIIVMVNSKYFSNVTFFRTVP